MSIFALDLDGVCANTPELWVRGLHNMFGATPKPGASLIENYALHEDLQCSQSEFLKVVDETIHTELTSAAPMDANWHLFVQGWIDRGHEVFILTKNPPESEPYIRKYLAKWHFQDMRIEFVDSVEEKMEYDFDLLVDDHPALAGRHNVLTYYSAWNKDAPNAMHVYNFADIDVFAWGWWR